MIVFMFNTNNENRRLVRDANGRITSESLFDSKVIHPEVVGNDRAGFKSHILNATKTLIEKHTQLADTNASKAEKAQLQQEIDNIIGDFYDYNFINANINAEDYHRNPDNWSKGSSKVRWHARRADGRQSESYPGEDLSAWMNDKTKNLPRSTGGLTNKVNTAAETIGKKIVDSGYTVSSSDADIVTATASISDAFDKYSEYFHMPLDTYPMDDLIEFEDVKATVDSSVASAINEHAKKKTVDLGPDI